MIAHVLLQVHDELILEVQDDSVEAMAHTMAHIMESVHTLDVPIVVEAKAGINWADMKRIEHAHST
jgi:DNA polymerase-1